MLRELGNPLRLKQESLERLRAELATKSDIISFQSDGKFCSFLACVGIQFELQHEKWDRLSAPLGVSREILNCQMIAKDEYFGVVFTRKDGKEFLPDHPSLKDLIDPSSLDENRCLTRIVIFPEKVAEDFRERGLELVIVRDWVLDSFLTNQPSYNYQFASEAEMDSKSALRQAQLLSQRQLSFSGTHDLADHLLGVDPSQLFQNEEVFRMSLHKIQKHQDQKLLTYTMGVVLDDLAQPIWYQSSKHLQALEELSQRLETRDSNINFTEFIERLRS